MLVIAQSMVLICAVCGLAMYLYIHVFSFRRLRHQERRFGREDANEARANAKADTETQVAVITAGAGYGRDALFYLYQEQIRRFIDAKIDILRASAETQNRILLMEAEAIRDGVALPPPCRFEPATITATNDTDTDVVVMVPVPFPAPAPQEPSLLSERFQAVRRETERNLAEIDQQIRSLPGPSLDHWVMAETLRSAD